MLLLNIFKLWRDFPFELGKQSKQTSPSGIHNMKWHCNYQQLSIDQAVTELHKI